MREMRVSLTEEEFRELMAGRVVRRDGAGGAVVISLQDIGYSCIMDIVTAAYNQFLERQATPR